MDLALQSSKSRGKTSEMQLFENKTMLPNPPLLQKSLQNSFLLDERIVLPDIQLFREKKKVTVCIESPEKKDITMELKANLKEYLADIELQTGRALHPGQIKNLEKYLEITSIQRLSPEGIKLNRNEFNQKRSQLRELWEMETGQKWPSYEQDVVVKGKVLRRKGQHYDAHHIIENSFGGPHRWWNLHPAAFPNEHQDGIHRDDGICSKLFGPIPKEFHHTTQPKQ